MKGIASGAIRLLAACVRVRGRPSLQPQVREDALDHRCFEDGRDDPELAAAVRAAVDVQLGFQEAASRERRFLAGSAVIKRIDEMQSQ